MKQSILISTSNFKYYHCPIISVTLSVENLYTKATAIMGQR